ncbi:MAG TPA: glycosyl transferase, partial [Flavobacteriales bacterium]|nr:glycosyl transferase [Flavobacteriales bacterium]
MDMTEKRKPKVSIFMDSLFGGGGQRSMLNLAHAIANQGYDIDLVLAQVEGPFLNEVQKSVNIIDLKASRALTSLPVLIKYLRRNQPVAMLSVFGHINILALLALRLAGTQTKLFVNEQNTVSLEAGNASSWRMRLMPRLMKQFYPWADGIVVVSQGVSEDLAQLIDISRERINVIYNPSIVRADVQEKSRAPLDHPWFKPDQPPVLIAVGRLQPQKDYTMLIEAFAQVRQKQSARLIILGEGRERSMLETLIAERGLDQDVSLPGFVRNPFAYMARASLFVLSSRWEGLPTVLIEALCCGTPVVATDCPSRPREILKDGKYGKLVPVGDA